MKSATLNRSKISITPTTQDAAASSTPKPVLRRLLLPLVTILTVLIGGAYFLLHQAHEARLRDVSTQARDVALAHLDAHLEGQARSLIALQNVLLNSRAWVDAIQSREHDVLTSTAQSAFEELRDKHDVVHLFLMDHDGRVLFRAHDTERHSDVSERRTTWAATQTDESAWGLEFGGVDSVAMRVVHPVKRDDETIGYLGLCKELGAFFEDLVQRQGLHQILLAHKHELDPLEHAQDWDQLPDHVPVFASMEIPPAALPMASCTIHDHASAADEVEFEGRKWRIMVIPVDDLEGRHIAEWMFLHDVTDLRLAQQRQMIVAAVVA